jgi:hypothetical protein
MIALLRDITWRVPAVVAFAFTLAQPACSSRHRRRNGSLDDAIG